MIQPKKSLGQHWLNDEKTLEYICDLADVKKSDYILEIGPGQGSLTRQLLKRKARVIAVELDHDLAQNLHYAAQKDLQIFNEDILAFDLTRLEPNYKVVANIPYYLTSKLIRVLSESPNSPQQITLLVQKEVAERICADPGKMSLLSVSAQFFYFCQLGKVVPASLFDPPPKVDSRLVNMLRKDNTTYRKIDQKSLFRIVKAGFSSRRKTLLNSLSGGLNLSKEATNELIKKAQIKPTIRPQQLTLENWISLTQAFTS